jgi:hypothetical protein
MTRKQKLSAYRLAEFGPDGPSLRTLRKWCEDGELPAVKCGKCWYVLIEKVKREELVERIMAA